jgi:hypothetical protein
MAISVLAILIDVLPLHEAIEDGGVKSRQSRDLDGQPAQ